MTKRAWILAGLAGAWIVMPLRAQTVAAVTAVPISSSVCSVHDLSNEQETSAHLLYASCGSGSLRLGEASSYVAASNPALGMMLVVRQTRVGTEVDLVKASADGTSMVEELSGEVRQALAEAGQGRPATFPVDLARFAVDGSIGAAASQAGLAQGATGDGGALTLALAGRTLLGAAAR